MGCLPSYRKPAAPAEFFDGVSDGSFRAGKSGRENYRQIEALDLTIVLSRDFARGVSQDAPLHIDVLCLRRRIGYGPW